ncbi:hypothetical protein F511_09955 [Dorcoceras hygrometricum]|uniref:Uncharacterized protein n=1 Tax=Dorcoceras hygrometricum TaxID=472368 RepID=A0A2Z7AJ29_9LAMI|nr:hypothetical protein F511_09955 [Dorcoceras hygrometricum]
MSLFNLQDVCIVIGSLATLDLPVIVDLIGIYVLKGPYCTLTTTNWFLQIWSRARSQHNITHQTLAPPFPPHLAAADRPSAAAFQPSQPSPDFSRGRTCSDHRDEEIPSMVNSSDLLVQTDEGLVFSVVDLIRRIYRRLHLKSQIPREFGWSQAPRRQQGDIR